ncbi:hypothetical protein PVIIG_06331 [Plasmodium vivax India VII]|uniref:VIR protein n=1 Tax=Plasmodium vivax India VII TaxID=1077284 RepID=A0A0J9SGH0_PLAVI|nr:hypothetical protein PVIIG_06331 [Plasmodium vivax India VII]
MATNPQYFTYQEYDEVKKSFRYVPDDNLNISFVNDIIARITNTPTKEGRLYDTFYQLKKFISRGHSFVKHGKDKCCNYINYYLNKTVRDSAYGVNDENFQYFDEFMRLDPKVRVSGIDCISKLSYMNKDVFEKMEKLYDLYDYFTKLRESDDPSALCHNISSLAEKYESVLQECKGKDDNLCNKLRNLKSVIVRDELVAKDKCTKNSFQSIILEIDPPPPPPPPKKPTAQIKVQVQHRNHGRAHTRPTVSVPSPQAHGGNYRETHATPPVSVSLSRSQGLEKQAHTLEKQVQILGKQIQVLEKQAREESERTLPVPQEQFPRQLPALPSIYPQQFPLKLPSLPSEPLDPSEESEETGPKGPFGKSEPEPELRQEQEQHIDILEDADPFLEDERDIFPEEGYPPAGSTMPTFNPEMIMEKMKIAVSKVLETVESVPVLGVSGAIGALFLLFKVSKIALKLVKLH